MASKTLLTAIAGNKNICIRNIFFSFVLSISCVSQSQGQSFQSNYYYYGKDGGTSDIYLVVWNGACYPSTNYKSCGFANNAWSYNGGNAQIVANNVGANLGLINNGQGSNVGPDFAYDYNSYGDLFTYVYVQGSGAVATQGDTSGPSTWAFQTPSTFNIQNYSAPFNIPYPSTWLSPGPLSSEFNGGTLQIVAANNQSGQTVSLNGNNFTATSNTSNTLDLNGNNLTLNSNFKNAGKNAGYINFINSNSSSGGTITIPLTQSYSVAQTVVGSGVSLYAGNISGSSAFTINGTTTFNGSNTFTGATIVNGGTLVGGAANSLSASSPTTVTNNGTINLSGFNQTVNNLTLSGGSITNGSLTANIASSGGLISTNIVGSSSLINNSGTTTLTAPNSYTGATTVNGGTLAVTAPSILSANSPITVNSGGTLDLGGWSQNTNSIALNGGAAQNGNLSGTINSTGGNINLIGGSASLNVFGSSASTGLTATNLSSQNTYSGSTIINSGASLGASNNYAFSPYSQVTVNANAILFLSGTQAIPSIILAGGEIAQGALAGNIISNGGIINTLSGAATLTINSGTTQIVCNTCEYYPNNYTGNTVVNGGTFAAVQNNGFSANSLTSINTGGTVNLGQLEQTINSVNLQGGLITSGYLIGNINSTGGAINNVQGSIYGYSSLTVTSGVTVLSGTNGFNNTYVNGGTINNTGTLNGPVTNSSGTSSSLLSATSSSNNLQVSMLASPALFTVADNPIAKNADLSSDVGKFNNSGWIKGAVVNDGQLNILGSSARVSGPITGAGEMNIGGFFRQEASISNGLVNVNRGGAFITTSDLNAQALNVSAGGAVVAASDITAPINVISGGALTSSGLRNVNGDVRNAGEVFQLTPGDKLNINGNYSQSASGNFTTLIAYDGNYGKIETSKNLSFEKGSTITAVMDRRLRPVSGTIYSAVMKGSATPFQSQINVLTNTPRFSMNSIWNGNQVDLRVSDPYHGALSTQTLSSVSAVQGPTLNALHQRYAVLNAVMEYDCNRFDKHNFCISAQARSTGFGTQATGAGVFNIAYRPTAEARMGAYLDYQAAAGNPTTYGPSTAGTMYTGGVNYGYDNATFGGYLGYSQSGYSGRIINTGVQAFVSGGYNPGRIQTTRALTLDPYGADFVDSQPGSGSATLNAYFARGLLGYGYALTDKATLMPYLGVRYTDVSRGGYMEGFNALVTQPLVFNSYYEQLVTGFSGMMLNGQLTDQLGVTAGLGAELDFSRAAASFSGYSPLAIQGSIMAFGFQHGGSWNGFRPTGTVGAYYDVMPNHRVSLNGYAGQQAWSSRTFTTGLLGYQIAF